MKSNRQIGIEVDTWIVEEDLPVQTHLKVIRKNDPDYGLTEQEIQDRNEFIRCYMMKEHEAIMMVPLQVTEYDFFIADCDVTEEKYSAFNTVD